MKKILITGKNSYVGNSFEEWIKNYSDKYSIDKISIRNDSWKEKDFSEYDVIFHVAGIAHIRETRENAQLYYNVNRDLTYEIAKKARVEGVKQFIFLSSMSVYGIESGLINEKSSVNPKSHYGKSKLQAEEKLTSLDDKTFKVAVIRPPMIYGKGCKGNYSRLAKFAMRIPIFPNVDNIRSMIFIDNLCEFVRLIIDDANRGLFFPQNEKYINTSELVVKIATVNGRKIKLTKLFNFIFVFFKSDTLTKVFGSLVYDKKMSEYDRNYCLLDFDASIEKTEQ